MKLNKEQIEQIDLILVKNRIKYIDIKFELIDHIASTIEEKIEIENCTFDEALIYEINKWKPMFINQSSFWIGIIYSFPKIVINKIETNNKRFSLFLLAISIVWAIPAFLYKSQITELIKPFVYYFNLLNTVSIGIMLTTIFMANYKSKPTTYRFLINHSIPIIFMCLFYIFMYQEMSFMVVFYTIINFLYAIRMIKYYFIHQKVLNKFQLL